MARSSGLSRLLSACSRPSPQEKRRAILAAPMTRAFKTFLVWLLMAVLPLHAVAAGIGMSCIPQHQADAVAAAVQHGDDQAHAHHGHHDAAQADQADSAPEAETQTHSSCSACSAFCVGAVAPPSAYSPVLSFDGSEPVVIAPAAFAAGFIPDGPQRPPRPQSA